MRYIFLPKPILHDLMAEQCAVLHPAQHFPLR